MQAASAPVDWASIIEKPRSSWRRQSSSPSPSTMSGRYGSGVGSAKLPGRRGRSPCGRRCRWRRRRPGHAVPGAGEGDDLVPAGDELGHPQRGLVGLRAGRQQQRLLQRRGQRLGQPPRQVDDRAREHPAEEVVERAGRLAQRRRDAGCECPRIELIWPEVKSSSSRPSSVNTQLPSARSTIPGLKGARPE